MQQQVDMSKIIRRRFYTRYQKRPPPVASDNEMNALKKMKFNKQEATPALNIGINEIKYNGYYEI
jgi:hypothetical protein